MTDRQFTAPHLVSRNSATSLTRVPLLSKRFSEAWFQSLLFDNPSLLPINELEPAFDGSVALARELPTEAGPVDIVYVNPRGFITLVETKLFRNPESRRQVVAQIVDYATAMSKWSYEAFRDAVKRTGVRQDDPIRAAVEDDPDFDPGAFHDAVSRNLSRGRFLLIIAGDGIQEGVEHLADSLSRSPHLGFTLALVELAVFSVPGSNSDVLVQPRTLARTREITRAIVELRTGVNPADVAISLPLPGTEPGRQKITEQEFLEELGRTTSPACAASFTKFLRQLETLGIELVYRDSAIGFRWVDPLIEKRLTFGYVKANKGEVHFNFVRHFARKAGLNELPARRYMESVAALIPGAAIKDFAGAKGFKYSKALVDRRSIALPDLLPKSREWLTAIHTAMDDFRAAAEPPAG